MIDLKSSVYAFHAFLLNSATFAWTPSTASRPCCRQPSSWSLQAKRGFASAGSAKSKKSKQKYTAYSLPGTESNSIEDFLHPRLLDPDVLSDIGRRIRNGQVVVLRDAFNDDLAEAMHQQLDWTENWDRNEDYFDDGYHYRHFNIYDQENFPPLFTAVNSMFQSNATKEFLTDITGRDCTGSVSGAPSYYGAGDHSLPHTDHIGQRSVAYIWHLSKRWKPEWGGALYWAPEPLANAFHHASFNTLVLFSVTPHSAHFVTTVSPQATEKRLAYNGWWHSSWTPAATDPLEDLLATREERMRLTHAQIMTLQDMLDDPWAPRIQPPERLEKIEGIRQKVMEELYPQSLSSPID